MPPTGRPLRRTAASAAELGRAHVGKRDSRPRSRFRRCSLVPLFATLDLLRPPAGRRHVTRLKQAVNKLKSFAFVFLESAFARANRWCCVGAGEFVKRLNCLSETPQPAAAQPSATAASSRTRPHIPPRNLLQNPGCFGLAGVLCRARYLRVATETRKFRDNCEANS